MDASAPPKPGLISSILFLLLEHTVLDVALTLKTLGESKACCIQGSQQYTLASLLAFEYVYLVLLGEGLGKNLEKETLVPLPW